MNVNSVNILKYLDMLIKHGNYTKAAQSLYISQSYLTQKIQKIELELGVEIINRQVSPLHLTQAGLAYYNHLLLLETQQENFKKEMSKYSNETHSTIRLGILSSLGTYLLPLFIPQYLQHHPEVKIELVESIPRDSEQKLLTGELDFFIGQNSEAFAPNVMIHNCGEHNYYMLIPESSKYYQQEQYYLSTDSIPLKNLLQEPLILTSKGSTIRRQVDHLLDKYKITANIILETNNIFTAIELAKKSLAVTILPENLEFKINKENYNLYPISAELITIRYFIAHHMTKTLSLGEKEFIDYFIQSLNYNIAKP